MVDITTIVGLFVGFFALVLNVLLEEGSLLALINAPAFLLIFLGTLGATMISFRLSEVRKLPGVIASAFRSNEQDVGRTIDRISRMAERARREGLLSLQAEIDGIDDPVLKRGLQMMVDGTDPETVTDAMTTHVEMEKERAGNLAAIMEAAGGYSPTIGIIGTVMGLVKVLSNLSDTEALSHSIALAFLATFYGILFANLFWLPMASKLKQNIKYKDTLGRMYVAGVFGLMTGEAPRTLKDRLEIFVGVYNTSQIRGGGDR